MLATGTAKMCTNKLGDVRRTLHFRHVRSVTLPVIIREYLHFTQLLYQLLHIYKISRNETQNAHP